MQISKERLWRTEDGRLVRDGDAAATSLAYTPGDEIQPRDLSLVPGDEPAGEPLVKAETVVETKPLVPSDEPAIENPVKAETPAKAAAKAMAKPEDKSAEKPGNK